MYIGLLAVIMLLGDIASSLNPTAISSGYVASAVIVWAVGAGLVLEGFLAARREERQRVA